MKKRKVTIGHIIGKRYDGMIGRCYRSKDKSNARYRALGIKVCKAWLLDMNTFKVWFLNEIERMGRTVEDVLASPKEFSLDRIDPKGHYTPENCRLVNIQTQARNKIERELYSVESAEGEIVNF